MVKQIKISNDTHEDLKEIEREDETFADVTARLVKIYRYTQKIIRNTDKDD